MTEVRSRGGAFAEHNERLIQQQQQQRATCRGEPNAPRGGRG